MTADARGAETTELLQTLIRNQCVNEGTEESGQEIRNADTIQSFLEGAGLGVERYDAAPGRTNLVARIEGSDPNAPSLCFDGHTDVVPVTESGWDRDPFGGELIDGEVWGRGAVDMLSLTASMAVVMRALAKDGFRPKGDLVFLAVADEEAGSKYGARWMAEHHPEVITTDYALSENGGIHSGPSEAPRIGMMIGEKGVAWRRLTLRGTPGHGSRPFRSDNALVKAAGVVQRITDYIPRANFHELWRPQVENLPIDDDAKAQLLDPGSIDELLANMPNAAIAGHLHSCSHTTFSANVMNSQTKTNVIPDTVTIDIDIRTMPGDGPDEVDAHLREALGDLYEHVEVEALMNDQASASPADTPLWDSLARAVANPFPTARITPEFIVGFTDNRVHRDLGAVAYGAGLFSPTLTGAEFGSRFHGNNERIDTESLALTTQFYLDVVTDLLG
ncbi:MAG: acetylornithine deacetylase/succinyl-diaminopimelate desuccinylase-like protein [Candidatus Poriferisodalaceae bacterium]|jgi:acetylornithine deacetylase/succinyl-diaminopimelate desuccinylase-like protein